MGIGDWGLVLGIGDWAQSPIPNPQSPIPNPQSPFLFYNNNFFQILNKIIKIKIIIILNLFSHINDYIHQENN